MKNSSMFSLAGARFAAAILCAVLLAAAPRAQELQEAPTPPEGFNPIERAQQAADQANVQVAQTGTTAGTLVVTPPEKPSPEDLTTTMTLQLKGQNIEQLVKFLTETTGKAAIYNQEDAGSVQITVTSPKPVTRGKALELIYDALLMKGMYVVELEDQIRIVKADAIKGMQFQTLGDDQDIQEMPDSNRMFQKIYKLKDIKADQLKQHLEKLVPETGMTIDSATNTVIIVDQLTRLKRYDRIIRALDRPDASDLVQRTFMLENTDAPEIAELMIGILRQKEQVSGVPSQQGPQYNPYSRRMQVTEHVAGKISIIPDLRMNTLIVIAPRDKIDEVEQLVKDLDQPRSPDIQIRPLTITHVEPELIGEQLARLFDRGRNTSEKDQVQIVPYEGGNQLLIRSSKANFDLMKDIVSQIDTVAAEKRETRSYSIKHLEAQELADQLTTLFQEKQSTNYYDYYFSSRSSRQDDQPKFISIVRNNQLVAMAKPKDFIFIEEMIKELDQPIDPDIIAPRIYQIRNTDANELVRVMEALFKDPNASRQSNPWDFWRPQTNQRKGAIQSMFGDIRFVVDNVTNRVVVLTSHPENYAVIDKMITHFDRFDPESSEVLVYELKYADALDVAARVNNLFSDGAVQQQGQRASDRNRSGSNGDDDNQNDQNDDDNRTIAFPWQSNQRQPRPGEESRPLNTLIGNVRVVPDERSSKLLIAAPSIYFSTLRGLIESLDQPEPKVNITARILEIAYGEERRIGVRWTPDPGSIDPGELENAFVGLGQLGFLDTRGSADTGAATVDTGRTFGGIDRGIAQITAPGKTILSGDINMALLIQLLLKNSKSRVVADPNITVNNNQTGNVFVGDSFPFRQGSQSLDTGAVNDQIEYRDVGVTLNIKPRINSRGEIVLTVSLINSSVRDERIGGDLVTNQTTLNSEVSVDSGQTMVLGGIRREAYSRITRRVPIVGYIPIVNWFFKKSDGVQNTRELLIFITPEVMTTRAEEDQLLHDTKSRIRINDRDFPQLDVPLEPNDKIDSGNSAEQRETSIPTNPS